MNSKSKSGIAVAIAWPETLCKQPGAWYDSITALLGINKGHYYKVGHAALLLIDLNKKEAHYYDFGRYHSPFQYGRVRSAVTDHDLKIITPVSFSDGEVDNIRTILQELNNNKSCHGDGLLVASETNINFESAQEKVLELQNASPLKYGPFIINGTNCSRFVNTALLAGKPNLYQQLLLRLTASPTPMWNIKSLGGQIILRKLGHETHCLENPYIPLQQ
ncbi:MAG: hypothetical protein ACJAZ2_001515 [Glaciecola sp.]|jgi:hypothetical protein